MQSPSRSFAEDPICATSTASTTRIGTTVSTSSFRRSVASRRTRASPTSWGSLIFRPKSTRRCQRNATETNLREHFPAVAESMDRFIQQIHQDAHGEVAGEIDVIRIPLNLYRARNFTARPWHPLFWDGNESGWKHPFSKASVFLVGDSAIGSPYFQSISLGLECAMYLADLLGQRIIMTDVYDRYETLMYKQWMRVYMRSKIIKHNKDIFERLDDTFGVLERLHIY